MKRIETIGLLALLVSVCLNIRHYTGKATKISNYTAKSEAETVRQTFVDTIPYYKPVPKDSTVIRYVTKRLPAGAEIVCKKEKAENHKDKDSTDFLCKQDSADVVVPITQNVYEDSTYRAVVSGYNVSLEEMTVFPRHEIVTIRQNSKTRRWSVGIQVGYGITPSGFQPYVGVGVTCNLFSF